ncbi:MAG: hypothetical protein GWO39_05245, partial [Gammaproteobacteria bacterium]|nr:hypothetical protein [Gammaproteobacteria bacterium]NIT63208.1 hypothetical protein [Gammaproteobacteria bacterium]NIV21455.1 hypothetical protein [Gammaproteobacteria bacterium]NIY31788.1 hypothetical protein [Gammaproteobacteria bacterium]
GVTAKDFTFERKTATDTFGNILTANNVELTTVGPSYDGGGVDVGFIWRVASLSFLRAQWSVVGYNVGGITL